MSALDNFNAAHLAIIEASAIVALLGAASEVADDQREAGASVACKLLEVATAQLDQLWDARKVEQAEAQP